MSEREARASKTIERVNCLLDEMEPGIADIARWAGIIGILSCSEQNIRPDDLVVVERALRSLKGRLEAHREAAFRATLPGHWQDVAV